MVFCRHLFNSFHRIYKLSNSKNNCVGHGMVLLDLQKAFDTDDHFTLLMKLEARGLSPDVVKWYHSYLSDL